MVDLVEKKCTILVGLSVTFPEI